MTKMKTRDRLMATTAAAALLLAGALSLGTAGTAFGASEVETRAGVSSTVRKPVGMGHQVRASEIIGMDVRNARDEKIGTIDDLVLARHDKVTYAVVSVGGFLGIGDKLVAVEFDRLRMSPKETLVLDATKEELKAQPEFKFNDPRANYRAMAADEYEDWKGKVSSYTAKAKKEGQEAKDEASEKLDAAWAEVEKQWAKLKDASSDTWEETKTNFEIAWAKFEEAWEDATDGN